MVAESTKTLQEQLLVRALSSSYITNAVLARNTPSLLTNPTYQVLGNILVRYYATDTKPISEASIKLGIDRYFKDENRRRSHKHEDPLTQQEELDITQTINDVIETKPDSSDEIEESLDKYVKKTLASAAILEEAQRDSDDLSKRVEEKLDDINSLDINGNADTVVDVYRDVRKKAETYINDLGQAKIPSGLKTFDYVMSGGLQKGQIAMIGGKSGFGKTVFLSNLSYYYSMVSGHNVLQVSLEELMADSYMRFDRMHYRVTPSDMLNSDGKIDPNFIKNVLAKPHKQEKGTLLFKRYTPNTLTIDGLRQCIDASERQKGLKLDVVVLDYADLMRTSKKSDNEAVQGEELFQNLSKLAQEENVILITGTQLNRSAGSQEVMTLESIEGSYRKINTTAFAGTLNGTKEERDGGFMRIYLDKIRNRFVSDDYMLFKFDKGTMLLTDETDAEKVEHMSLINQDASNMKAQRRAEYAKGNGSDTSNSEMQDKANEIMSSLMGGNKED